MKVSSKAAEGIGLKVLDGDGRGFLKFFLPLFQIGEEGVGGVVGTLEGLVVGGEGDGIVECGAFGSNDKRIVVLVGWQLAHDVLGGDADAETHGLALVTRRVFL